MGEDDRVGGLGSTEEHCKMLRNRGLDDLAGFYEWFEANTKVENGDVVELPLEKLDQQDYFEETKALYLLNAFLLGGNWEKENPSPITDYANFPNATLRLRLLFALVGGMYIGTGLMLAAQVSWPLNALVVISGLAAGLAMLYYARYYKGDTSSGSTSK
ncbi:hypothetical protein OB919_16045 [Halobacteria archaeon AArc-curdl1]|uniref:Uncharacterized protein n=1 Tax=Natronosalvus hydrolyticus TaxID=2979988 RepID=A0AAP3E812_9EURY|nr:hypothetical protein [Halobacteria archaeon AArc-curdl1]